MLSFAAGCRRRLHAAALHPLHPIEHPSNVYIFLQPSVTCAVNLIKSQHETYQHIIHVLASRGESLRMFQRMIKEDGACGKVSV